jgi:hypothetical protein
MTGSAAAAMTGSDMKMPPTQRTDNRLRWEYRTELMHRNAELDQFGEEGWELVSVLQSPADEAVFYFKRKKV